MTPKFSSYRAPDFMRRGRDLAQGFTRDGRPLPGTLFYAALEVNDRVTAHRIIVNNLAWAMETFLKVAVKSPDGSGEAIQPVVLSPIQRKAVRRWQWKLKNGIPIRENIWKPRQIWWTTLCAQFLFLMTRFNPSYKTVVMGNNPRTNAGVRDKINVFESHMLTKWGEFDALRLDRSVENKDIIKWFPYSEKTGQLIPIPNTDPPEFVEDGGAQIRFENGSGQTGSTSGTNQGLLFTEIGMDEPPWLKQFDLNNKTVMAGAAWTFIIREGAAYGKEGEATSARALRHVFEQTEKGLSNFENHFISVLEHHEYRLPVEPGEKPQPSFSDPALLRREQDAIDKAFRVADEKWQISKMVPKKREEAEAVVWSYLKWRWELGIPDCDSYEDHLMQYPLDLSDAKISKTTTFFQSVELNEAIERTPKDAGVADPRLERVRIYHEPEPETENVVFFDPTGSDLGGDPGAGFVFNPLKLRMEATWHGYASTTEQAAELAELGWRYRYRRFNPVTGREELGKPALMVVEVNLADVLRIIRDDPLSYPNIWRYRAVHGVTERQKQGKRGFYMDNTNKDCAADLLHAQWQTWKIEDVAYYQEMVAFGRTKTNQLRAKFGHDDRVDCLIMCAHWCEITKHKAPEDWKKRWLDQSDPVPMTPGEELALVHAQMEVLDQMAGRTLEQEETFVGLMKRALMLSCAGRKGRPRREGFERARDRRPASRAPELGYMTNSKG